MSGSCWVEIAKPANRIISIFFFFFFFYFRLAWARWCILLTLAESLNFTGSVDIYGVKAMYRGARVRTRGGRGRGFIVNNITNDYKRSDQNYFEVLSGLPDNGDDELTGELHMNSWGSENEGFTTVRKRQRVSTGGKSNAPETSRDIDSELLISEFEKNEYRRKTVCNIYVIVKQSKQNHAC